MKIMSDRIDGMECQRCNDKLEITIYPYTNKIDNPMLYSGSTYRIIIDKGDTVVLSVGSKDGDIKKITIKDGILIDESPESPKRDWDLIAKQRILSPAFYYLYCKDCNTFTDYYQYNKICLKCRKGLDE